MHTYDSEFNAKKRAKSMVVEQVGVASWADFTRRRSGVFTGRISYINCFILFYFLIAIDKLQKFHISRVQLIQLNLEIYVLLVKYSL